VGKPLPQTYQHLVHTLKEQLAEVAKERLQAVIVYGSRAGGEAEPDSDLEVAY
jgi:predicted nucleotidyltransferase